MQMIAIICATPIEYYSITARLESITPISGRLRACEACDTISVYCGGVGMKAAAKAVNTSAGNGATYIIEYGAAGSLSEDLPKGSILVPNQIIDATCSEHASISTDTNLQKSFIDSIESAQKPENPHTGYIATVNKAVSSDKERIKISEINGVVAVTMESYAIANTSSERNLPYIAVRVITDSAGTGSIEDYNKHYKDVLNNIGPTIYDAIANLKFPDD